jgi:hypothetical protein
MQKYIKNFRVIALVIASFGLSPAGAWAASSSDFTQSIAAGVLSTDIQDASRVPVASPTVALAAKNFSFNCQTSTGTFGTASQRIYATNPGAAVPNGWNVTLAATGGATSTWANTGSTKFFDFNDATSAGCTDGADTDTYGGQMTVDPSVGTLTADCTSCTTTGITKGSSTAFVEGTANSVTLLNAANTASNPFRGYLTGVGMSQTLPAEQGVDSTYKINLTLTITAL